MSNDWSDETDAFLESLHAEAKSYADDNSPVKISGPMMGFLWGAAAVVGLTFANGWVFGGLCFCCSMLHLMRAKQVMDYTVTFAAYVVESNLPD